MSDTAAPTTGATEEQIEAAALRMHNLRASPGHKPHPEWPCAMCCGQADAWAPNFVPPGMVIAPADAVLTAEDRAAIGRINRYLRGRDVYGPLPTGAFAKDHAIFARLAAGGDGR